MTPEEKKQFLELFDKTVTIAEAVTDEIIVFKQRLEKLEKLHKDLIK